MPHAFSMLKDYNERLKSFKKEGDFSSTKVSQVVKVQW
jgi:hypothetical protein